MQPQRETMTDRLADIIHIIHLGGKSGILTVERGEGRTLEEGVIAFVEGRAVEAKAGTQSGVVAFNYLNSWMTCRFSFVNHPTSNTPTMPPAHLPALLPAPASQPEDRSQLTLRSGTPFASSTPPRVFPSRLNAGEMALQHSEGTLLSRVHRRLLLLINGQRSVSELARLMARSQEDVYQLLNDLERAGLIKQ